MGTAGTPASASACHHSSLLLFEVTRQGFNPRAAFQALVIFHVHSSNTQGCSSLSPSLCRTRGGCRGSDVGVPSPTLCSSFPLQGPASSSPSSVLLSRARETRCTGQQQQCALLQDLFQHFPKHFTSSGSVGRYGQALSHRVVSVGSALLVSAPSSPVY